MSTWPDRRRWLLACASAETVGMGASATAARLGQRIADGAQGSVGDRWLAVAVVVGGGLVEGVALGGLQGGALAGRWPALRRVRFALLTVLVAGIGWAVASAPGVLAGDDGGGGPSLLLMVPGALGLGLMMGAILGAVQARAMRGVVAYPSRWVAANAAAWPLAMAVIFTGASTAGASWPIVVVAGYGALTGAAAGAALGLVSGWWLESLDGQPLVNRVALHLIETRRLGVERGLVGLAVRGRRTGRVLRFPVQFALADKDLVIVPGHADRKSWWRNLEGSGAPVEVLRRGRWVTAWAEVLTPGDPGYDRAAAAYRARWRHSEPTVWAPIVVLHGVSAGVPASSWGLESVR